MFKLQGQLIQRHPEFDMADRLLLDKLDLSHGPHGKVCISGKNYDLTTVAMQASEPAAAPIQQTSWLPHWMSSEW